MWGLVYVDQGLLSSNGVTGTRSTDPSNAAVNASDQGGLQVARKLQLLGDTGLPAYHIVALAVSLGLQRIAELLKRGQPLW